MKQDEIVLTHNQRAALDRYAKRHGRRWKIRLHQAWMDGNYGALDSPDDSAYLQQVRNTLGPVWLSTYKPETGDAL